MRGSRALVSLLRPRYEVYPMSRGEARGVHAVPYRNGMGETVR